VNCPVCGSSNEAGRKFCGECGSPLAQVCPSCGAANPATVKFCGECGSALTRAAASRPTLTAQPVLGPMTAPGDGDRGRSAAERTAERRLVSVLFADLVGFTALSEPRDAEEVRDLLTRYFDTCRQLVARYGGTVEKFIGDAVMAVWGTPTAQEDDAERAVRTAIELTASVADLGRQVGTHDLRARVGVLTGEAAVTLGAEGQGMVAGDLVNTASRIQAAAQPGSVLVGDDTRAATEAAIVYEDAGSHELKGKAERLHLWRAVRVVAGIRGAYRQTGLEPPFVGRDAELRLVKELFHSSAEEGKATLVSVVGVAGIGKSRLSWEFFKYLEGLADLIFWHRGRCLSYGEGVTYWALAEMVRMRGRIAEGEDQASALAKLHRVVEENLPDGEERKWVEPRLAHLLGLEERSAREGEDLFAAWRLFLERLSERQPTVLVFEDMQWADASLLDFVEYQLDWSRDHPLFVITLARPELMEKRPNWGAGKRNFHSLYLEPLTTEAMEELVTGLVPGLPDELRSNLLARAEGVPLYAVETVRMLLDRGLLVEEGSVYRPTGTVGTLEIPQTLHALIAARLDGLAPEERRLVQDAAVIGKTFTRAALSAVSGLGDVDLEPRLSALVRKEVLSVQADPRSPERGQYGFLQDLVRHVAYETLSKRDRKARHLAAAGYLERSWGGDEEEIVEVVASHYVDAYRAAPDAPDAAEIRANARRMLAAAGERAASLAANEEAERYFDQAAELADDPVSKAELHERAGARAWAAGSADRARAHFERAMALFGSAGLTHPAARVSARLGDVDWRTGSGLSEAIDRMEAAFAVLSEDEPDEDLAMLAAQLARLHVFAGDLDLVKERVHAALRIAESLWLPEVISQGLITEGIAALFEGRPEKALALTKHALEVALDNDLPAAALRGYANLAEILCRRDRYGEAVEIYVEALALARRIGDRPAEDFTLTNLCYPLWMTGRWDDALSRAGEVPSQEVDLPSPLTSTLQIRLHRGEMDEARSMLAAASSFRGTSDLQNRTAYLYAQAAILRTDGDVAGALAAGEEAFALRESVGIAGEGVKGAFVEAMESALVLGDVGKADALLSVVESLPPGEFPPFLKAQAARFRARLDPPQSDQGEAWFKMAAGWFRELEMPFWMAVTLLEHAEWLRDHGRSEDSRPLAEEAASVFEGLGALPWAQRAAALRSEVGVPARSISL
jgi:class 3 adenylate cyclase/tetratricopeptide (TPR) repeat protein